MTKLWPIFLRRQPQSHSSLNFLTTCSIFVRIFGRVGEREERKKSSYVVFGVVGRSTTDRSREAAAVQLFLHSRCPRRKIWTRGGSVLKNFTDLRIRKLRSEFVNRGPFKNRGKHAYFLFWKQFKHLIGFN